MLRYFSDGIIAAKLYSSNTTRVLLVKNVIRLAKNETSAARCINNIFMLEFEIAKQVALFLQAT